VETLGEHLKRRREEQGITLEDIESVTKISLSYLRDMEEDRFDRLPASIFALGFLKQYAQCIGLDPQDVVLRYRVEVRREGLTPSEGMTGKSWSVRRRAFWILLGLLGGLVALWLFLSPGGQRDQERVRSIRFPRTTERESKKQLLREEIHAASEAAVDRGAGAAGAGEGESGANAPAGVPDSGPVAVTLQALRGTKVTCAVDGGAARTQVLRAGDRVSWQGEESLRLEIGNGEAVRIFYRGEVYEELGRKGEVVHIVFPPPTP